MRRLGLALTLSCALGFAAGAQEQSERPAIPLDTLPRPLLRTAQLGAEDLTEGVAASDTQVALGRRLFFDPILSRDRNFACASCHRPELGLADDRKFSLGHAGEPTERNAPSVWNKALSTNVMWDGSASTLEAQALMPIDSESELGLGTEQAVQRLIADADYKPAFEEAYGAPPTRELLGQALADFLRALVVADSPVDRFRSGVFKALDEHERSGLWLYEGRGGCWRCHSGPNLSDESFHNTGIGSAESTPEAGRFAITQDESDRGKFRTPGLRLLTQTAPYMHDGSLATLEEVVEFYRKGGHPNSNLSRHLKPLELTDADAANLVAFLKALSR